MGCGFEDQSLIARAEGSQFDDVAIVARGRGAVVLWSDRSGLYARDVRANGEPRGDARRVFASCPGGIDAAIGGDGVLLVACARPADRDRGREGEISILRVRGARSRVIARGGPVGSESFGVSLAASGEHIAVGWRNADVFTARAHFGFVRGGELEASVVSDDRRLASAPSVMLRRERVTYAYTESWMERDGLPAGRLFVKSFTIGQQSAYPLDGAIDVGDIDGRVRVSADERGTIVAFRDRRPRGRALRAFAGRIGGDLRLPLERLRSPLRADAEHARPQIVPCGDHLIALSTRDTSREVTMVTLRRLDAELRSVGPEHQIYEYHARFPHALAACVNDRLMILVGERQSEVEPSPRLRTFTMRCAVGVAHERTPSIEGQVLRKRGAY